MFICNHCPYVKRSIERIVRDCAELKSKGFGSIAVMPNDPLYNAEDSFDNMKRVARDKGFPFPYVIDETQDVARAYRAACTPDIFLFDASHRLAYRGQLDDSRPSNMKPVTGRDLRAALDAVLEGRPVSGEQIPSIGCNIKWKPGTEPGW